MEKSKRQEIVKEIDRRTHLGFTLDRQGDLSRARNDGYVDALKYVLELTGEPYEHDEDRCEECQAMEEVMDGLEEHTS